MNKKKLVIVVWILTTLMLLGVWIIHVRNTSIYNSTSRKEPERGGPKTVDISNTGELTRVLLPEQFSVFKNQLSTYILGRVKSNAATASIIGKPIIARDGVISVVVLVDKSQQFMVKIDRITYFDKVVFSVPVSGYSVTTQTYGSAGD